jgi:hypothetical protein
MSAFGGGAHAQNGVGTGKHYNCGDRSKNDGPVIAATLSTRLIFASVNSSLSWTRSVNCAVTGEIQLS